MIYANIFLRSSIRENYNTSTKDHFKESRGATGSEPLPSSIYKAGSGFNTGTVNTLPLQREVKKPRISLLPAIFLFSHECRHNAIDLKVVN